MSSNLTVKDIVNKLKQYNSNLELLINYDNGELCSFKFVPNYFYTCDSLFNSVLYNYIEVILNDYDDFSTFTVQDAIDQLSKLDSNLEVLVDVEGALYGVDLVENKSVFSSKVEHFIELVVIED